MKTVRVRIAVAVNEKGEWLAKGECYAHDAGIDREVRRLLGKTIPTDVHFIEADIPVFGARLAAAEGTVVP